MDAYSLAPVTINLIGSLAAALGLALALGTASVIFADITGKMIDL